MIKVATLFVLLFNPVTNEEKTLTISFNDMNECLYQEELMYANNSAMGIELSNTNYELNESYCQ